MTKLALVLVIVLGGVAAAQTGSGETERPRPPVDTTQARAACVAAMNADPTFAKSIQDTIDKQLDQRYIDLNVDANNHIQKNEAHVIYAYAALWLLAAGFVVFLWRRQQKLRSEIDALRRDLEAAGSTKS
jgi:hypothetical protein